MSSTQKNELLIQITQYINKNNLETSRIFLTIDCFFNDQVLFENHVTFCFTLNDLCNLIGRRDEILSLDFLMCTFHVPVKFMGIVKDKRDFSLQLPYDNTTLGVGYSFSTDHTIPTPFFSKEISFTGVFFAPMRFTFANFADAISNIALWECGVEFRCCHFADDVNFKYSFLGKTMVNTSVIFMHCVFHKQANFFSSSFGVNTYFHRSTFKGEALFYRSNFLSIANFYFTIFEKTPNFSMCTFKDSKLANFIGIDISRFDMKNIGEYIREKAKSERNEENLFKGRGLEYLQIQHILNIRDSFRVIKETLNAQVNILESQKWHKLELYAKEIELKYKRQIKNLEKEATEFDRIAKQDVINNKKSQKLYLPRITQNDSAQMLEINKREKLKNTIDYIQLWFYRNTSDHHTDLLKIISWTLIVIGTFGLIFFVTKCFQNSSILTLLNPYAIALSLVGAISLGLLKIMSYIKKLFFFAGLGFISTLWIACYKPTLIFGAINLIDKTPRSGLENLLLVLYTLIMILLLFSLQKTARKNSIIPS